MKRIKRLGDAELDIMQVIWSSDVPVNSQFVAQGLEGKRDWQLASILTVLSRLVTKGFLTCERRGRNNYYTAIISKQEYQEADFYDYIIVNDDADKAAAELSAIMTAERCRAAGREQLLTNPV